MPVPGPSHSSLYECCRHLIVYHVSLLVLSFLFSLSSFPMALGLLLTCNARRALSVKELLWIGEVGSKLASVM